jgi:hypothetical protein
MYDFIKRLALSTLICLSLSTSVFAETEAMLLPAEFEVLTTHPDVTFVYVPDSVRDVLASISVQDGQGVRELCSLLAEGAHVARQDVAAPALACAIDALKKQAGAKPTADGERGLASLLTFKRDIESGDALIKVEFEEDALTKGKKCQVFCSLRVNGCLRAVTLNVVGNTTIGGNLTVYGTINGPLGIIGAQGPTGATGAAGSSTGATGPIGATGAPSSCCSGSTGGLAGVIGAAEYVQQIQGSNISVAHGNAVSFTVDLAPVFNSIPASIVPSFANNGTVFTLNTTGTYVLDYEMSLDTGGNALALWTGASSGSLTEDHHTVAGSTTGTVWIHGRAFVGVGSSPVVVMVSPVLGAPAPAPAVVTAGGAPNYITRMTILKIS